jgi:hypothetical protein
MAGRRDKVATSAGAAPPPKTPPRAAPKQDIEELRVQIARRLEALSPEDRRSRRGQQVFLESVLVWEFGDQITTDPAFGSLTARIQQAIEQEPVMSAQFGDLLESL